MAETSNPNSESSDHESSSSSSSSNHESTSSESSEPHASQSSSHGARKHCCQQVCERYKKGKSRKAYRLQKGLDSFLESSDVDGACKRCAMGLKQIQTHFMSLKHQGTELKKRKKQLPMPGRPDRDHYRNLKFQNEWLRANVFDTMGNYLFCHCCIRRVLHISNQRLARQREVTFSKANTTDE